MKILIIGASGMLGHKLVQVLGQKLEVWATIRGNFKEIEQFGIINRERLLEHVSIEEFSTVEAAVKSIKPAVIINATGIIKQIPSASDVIKTLNVNSIFPNQLANLAAEERARLILISTDCVFSGRKGLYKETDITDASDLYGRSKQLGEVSEGDCLTLRTSIIGRELKTAHGLLEWFLNAPEKSVKGYKNAVFSGFPTVVLAEIIAAVIEKHPHLKGLYHVSSEPINKFDLLHIIREFYKLEKNIELFEDFVIDRSLDSTEFRNAVNFQPKSWREMIEEMWADDKFGGIYQNINQQT